MGDQQIIGIWDFYTGEFKEQIEIKNSISCLWENNFILISCEDLTIKIADLIKKKIMKSLECLTDKINYNTIKLWKQSFWIYNIIILGNLLNEMNIILIYFHNFILKKYLFFFLMNDREYKNIEKVILFIYRLMKIS